jgi:hypothetical protein
MSDEQKMHPEWKARWLKALRSGEYRRAKGCLQENGAYCCLGVLCEVANVEYEPDWMFLPDELAKLVGLPHDTQSDLANLNDGLAHQTGTKKRLKVPRGYKEEVGISFKSLADWIEKNL